MKINKIVEDLLELKKQYPNLTNEEILKIYEIYMLSEINRKINLK